MYATAFLFFLLGSVFLGGACYIPHKERFSSDQTFGTMLLGLAFAIACCAAGFVMLNK